MKNAEVKLQFVTPCIMSGAEQRKAEFRAPSVRGNLRWWMRALGCSKELVNALFGSANGDHGMRSRVIVRDTTVPEVLKDLEHSEPMNAETLAGSSNDYFLWPLAKKERGVISAGTTVSFSIIVRDFGEAPKDVKKKAEFERAKGTFEKALPELKRALKAFLLFGALGTRSRRCYGSIWPTDVVIDGKRDWNIPKTKADFKNAVADLKLPSELIVPTIVTHCGVYNAFSNDELAIVECSNFLAKYRRGKYKPSIYGKNDHDARWANNNCHCVYRVALGLPLVQTYSDYDPIRRKKHKVESKIDGYERLASPLHFKVVKLDGGFVPLAIFFPKMVPPNGTMVRLSGGEVRGLPLNTKIINVIKDDDQLIKIQ